MEALKIEGLSKSFGGVEAVRSVSMSLERGERRVLIGLNGAGKTTMLNLISGEATPTAGRVYFFSRDITKASVCSRVRLGLSRSFQLTSLFFNLTVLDNALLALQALKRFHFEMFRLITDYNHLFTEAQELLELTDLWRKRDTLVAHLSYGEQRQMEVILALASKPKLLILDEPTSGVSIDQTDAFINMIRNLSRDITMLIVAHNMDVVFGLADWITVLHHGQVVAEGNPKQIQDDSMVKELYLGKQAYSNRVPNIQH